MCCSIETNKKLTANYYERTAIKKGKKRSCALCGHSLSRYNEGRVCGGCLTKRKNANMGEASALVDAVSWL